MEENLGQLMQRLHHRAASLIARTVNEIASLRVTPTPQDPSKRTYFGRKTPRIRLSTGRGRRSRSSTFFVPYCPLPAPLQTPWTIAS